MTKKGRDREDQGMKKTGEQGGRDHDTGREKQRSIQDNRKVHQIKQKNARGPWTKKGRERWKEQEG